MVKKSSCGLCTRVLARVFLMCILGRELGRLYVSPQQSYIDMYIDSSR